MSEGEHRVRSFCRICQAFCGTTVVLEGDRIARISGDRADPISNGYICPKGAHAHELAYAPDRLLNSLERTETGFASGASELLLGRAGDRLRRIVDEHGGGAVAIYLGTQALFNAATPAAAYAFAAALGTPRLFGTMTIDQSAKWIAEARLGGWRGGIQSFDDADCWMIFGSNPLVSMVTAGGAAQFAFVDPVRRIRRARERGLRLIVIDPRVTETARHADLHLRPYPGHDGPIAAALLREILARGWQDAAFCADHVDDLSALREAVEPFGIAEVAAASGVEAGQLALAARWFAEDARSGMAGSGTGPNMARHSNVAEHLIQCLNVVCGRFPRAGERVANAGVLNPGAPLVAQSTGPMRSWETGPRSARHQLGTIKGQMMTATLADDILWDGDDRIRALICLGGNPVVAWPDQDKTRQALDALDLLVVVDPLPTATAARADYVFAPRLMYERPDHTGFLERMFPRGFVHATPAVVADPPGSDLVDDWAVLAALAQACGRTLEVGGAPVAGASTEVVLQSLSRVELAGFFAMPGGVLVDASATVGPAEPDAPRFMLVPADVADEVAELVTSKPRQAPAEAELRLTVRRHRETMNSVGTAFPSTRRHRAVNAAYLHPDDIARLALPIGEAVEIRSAAGRVIAQLAADETIRRGTIAVGHCWSGDRASDLQTTNRLVDSEAEIETINRMPAMTGLAVVVRRREPSAAT